MSMQVETRREPQALVIALSGDVNVDGEASIRGAYGDAVAGDAPAIVIDLSGAEYINTSGISVLMTLAMQAKEDALPLAVACESAHYRKVFDLVRFSTFAAVHEDAATAIASFDGDGR